MIYYGCAYYGNNTYRFNTGINCLSTVYNSSLMSSFILKELMMFSFLDNSLIFLSLNLSFSNFSIRAFCAVTNLFPVAMIPFMSTAYVLASCFFYIEVKN